MQKTQQDDKTEDILTPKRSETVTDGHYIGERKASNVPAR